MRAADSTTVSRFATSALIGLLVAGALGLNWLMSSTTAAAERDAAAMSAHVQARQCVIADSQGQRTSLYRCDLPNPREYVDAGALQAEARAAYP